MLAQPGSQPGRLQAAQLIFRQAVGEGRIRRHSWRKLLMALRNPAPVFPGIGLFKNQYIGDDILKRP